MEDNRRNSGDSTLDSFEVINIMDSLEEVDGGSSYNPICKHCQKKYVQKDIITWVKAECKSGFCVKCGEEMISLVAKNMTSYGSLHEIKVYKVKEKPATVSSIIEKPQPEGPSKQNMVCKLCKMKYEKECDVITWFKIECEEQYCCLDCGKSKCASLWKAMKDSAPTLELKMYEETEKFASLFSDEKTQPAEGPSNQIICPCCNCIVTCMNCKGGNVSCQSTCSCCIGNKSKNTEAASSPCSITEAKNASKETSAVKQSGDEIKLRASKIAFMFRHDDVPVAREIQNRCFYCDCKDQHHFCTKCFNMVFKCPGSCRCCEPNRREKEEETERIVREITEAMEEDHGPSATGVLPSMK